MGGGGGGGARGGCVMPKTWGTGEGNLASVELGGGLRAV
jgi:hypothetical protein